MRELLVVFLIFWQISTSKGLLWTLFGFGCDCCQCGKTTSSMSNIFHPQPTVPLMSFPRLPSQQPLMVQPPKNYDIQSNYRGPPSTAPTSREQLNELEDELKYSTNQIILLSTTTPSIPVRNPFELAQNTLNQLEEELGSEKYRFLKKPKKPKNRNKNKKKKKNKLRVFTYQHRGPNQGVMSNFEIGQKISNDIEFIPIQVGVGDDLAKEEPAGPPPNVRNKIIHDNSVIHRRFMLN